MLTINPLMLHGLKNPKISTTISNAIKRQKHFLNNSPSDSSIHATMNSGTLFPGTHTHARAEVLSYTYNHTARGCWPYLSHLGGKK